MKTRLILSLIMAAAAPIFGASPQSPSDARAAVGPPLSTGAARNPIGGEVLSVDSVVEQVLLHNSSLRAARANWEAMKQRIPQARAWEDPRAGVDVERSGTTRFTTFSDNEWMVSQEIPVSGKNRLRGRAATADAAGAYIELHRRELELAVRARAAYFRLANAFAQFDLTRKNLDLWKQFTTTARTKYELGTQSQADVLVAETETGRLEESLFDFERQVSDAQSDLNVLMNRPPKSPLGHPGTLRPPELTGTMEDLQQMALLHRPELQLLHKKLEASNARLTLAKREWIPDPEIRLEARQFNGSSKFIQEYDTGVFIKVPWVNRSKYKAAIAEAQSLLESNQHDFETVHAETLGMVRNQFKKLETLHHHYELFRAKLAPLAWQTVESKRLSYESDKATLLDLLTAQRTARETESAMQQQLADYLTARAELDGMLGSTMDHPTGKP